MGGSGFDRLVGGLQTSGRVIRKVSVADYSTVASVVVPLIVTLYSPGGSSPEKYLLSGKTKDP